jgi:hypothetical protein
MDKNETVEANNKRLAWVFLPESRWNLSKMQTKHVVPTMTTQINMLIRKLGRIWIMIVGVDDDPTTNIR